MTDPDGDGVYEADINLAAGNYEFKFTYDNWTGQENLDPATADSVCTLTTGIYTNRYITIGSSDTTLPVYCWEECVSCAPTATGCDELFFSEYSKVHQTTNTLKSTTQQQAVSLVVLVTQVVTVVRSRMHSPHLHQLHR